MAIFIIAKVIIIIIIIIGKIIVIITAKMATVLHAGLHRMKQREEK